MPQITQRTAYLNETRLIGMSMVLSLDNNTTAALWQGFMPRLGEIEGRLNEDLMSVAVYPPTYFQAFDYATPFEKIAAVEVAKSAEIPLGMAEFVLPGVYTQFSTTRAVATTTTSSNTFSHIGCRLRPTISTTAPILRCWVPNTKTTILIHRKKSGYPLS